MVNVRIPPIASLETAIRIYFSKIELSTGDVRELFPSAKAKTTIVKLKQKARELMVEENRPCYNARSVNTEVAFRAWGLDIADLENRYEKLKKFKIKEV